MTDDQFATTPIAEATPRPDHYDAEFIVVVVTDEEVPADARVLGGERVERRYIVVIRQAVYLRSLGRVAD